MAFVVVYDANVLYPATSRIHSRIRLIRAGTPPLASVT